MEDEANISISPTTHSFNKEFLSTYYVPDTIEQSAPVTHILIDIAIF